VGLTDFYFFAPVQGFRAILIQEQTLRWTHHGSHDSWLGRLSQPFELCVPMFLPSGKQAADLMCN
jgi:hypothetical protein